VGSVTIMEPFQSARDADAQLSLQIPGKREQKQSALCKSVSVAGESLIDELWPGPPLVTHRCGAVSSKTESTRPGTPQIGRSVFLRTRRTGLRDAGAVRKGRTSVDRGERSSAMPTAGGPIANPS
jgi:hypothetical protein